MTLFSRNRRDQPGFLTRLARNKAGNTLALMAAAIIPLCGLVGGGVDLARMYITKTRLQHACDAGALAGRKQMGGGTWTQNNNAPNASAVQFFNGNFADGSYGSSAKSVSFTENSGTVTGNASVVLPMTIMQIFGFRNDTIAVNCQAEMRLPNTDVMFVLDTTGSMSSPQPGDSVNKITALKTAVKCFYEIVARLKTNASCATDNPTGGTGNQVQIRFGFVPFATNVNVGYLLQPSWFADSRKYQTREWQATPDWADWVTYSYYKKNFGCNPAPANTGTQQYQLITQNGYCVYQTRYKGRWHYAQLPVNVGLLKNGNSWKTSFQWPIGTAGVNRTISWDGCIEERRTTSHSNYNPIDPIHDYDEDLDIDTVPSSDTNSQWGMVLPDLIYTRAEAPGGGQSDWTLDEKTTSEDYNQDIYYACPVPSKKLQQWPSASDFDAYVDQLVPEGNTYHDIGLLWGARLMSPTGIFGAENAHTPQGGDIERHLIFMTDGDACTGVNNYTAYGVNWFDRRTVGANTVPTEGCGHDGPSKQGNLTAQVNARTEALCEAIKNKNITLWVVAFGQFDAATKTRLQNCSTDKDTRYFEATNAPELQATFKTIADQISQLGLSK